MADNNPNVEENTNVNNQSSGVTTAPKAARAAVEPQYGDPNTGYNQGQYQGNAAQQNWNNQASSPQPNPTTPAGASAGQTYYNNVAQNVADNAYFNVEGTQPQPNNNQQNQQPDKPKKSGGWFKRFTDFLVLRWWLVLLLVVAIALAGLGFYAFQLSQDNVTGTFNNVEAFIEAPTTASSGSPVRWKVRVVNQNSVSIQQIEVRLNFDRTFRYTKAINPDPADSTGSLYNLASLSALGEGTSEAIIQFEGTLSGNIDEEAVMSGEVSYVPTPNIGQENSRVTVPIEAERTRITSPQIGVTMTPTQREVQNGSEAEIAVVFENLSEKELKDLRIRMTYPDRGGFTYSSSELILDNTTDVQTTPDDGNNVWFLSSLPRLRTQTLKVRGIVQGADGVRLNFLVEIDTLGADGTYQSLRSTTADVVVTSQPLVLTTEVEGRVASKSFEPGDTLTFVINYQNKSNRSLTNLEILGFVDDEANLLDYQTLAYVGGNTGDLNNGVVQWTARGVPQLETLPPQARGTLKYTVEVKGEDAFKNQSLPQTAYTLRPRAEASSTEIKSIQFSGDEYKALGQLTFIQDIKSTENSSDNATVEVTWSLGSRQTKINDVRAEAITTLPPSSWKNIIVPDSQKDNISYNPVNGKIEWVPGSIEQYAGNGKDLVSVTFTIEVTAQENQALRNIEVFDSPTVVGVDDFTGESYELSSDAVSAQGN